MLNSFVFFSVLLLQLSVFADEGSLLTIKGSVLNTRSSAGVQVGRKDNRVKSCILKKGDNFNAVDFKFIDGVPWCEVMVSNIDGCPKESSVWVIGSNRFIKEVAPMVFQDMIPDSLKKSESTQAECTQCKATQQKLMDLSLKSVQFGPPIGLTLCGRTDVPIENESVDELEIEVEAPAEEECNCRGITSEFGYRMHPVKKVRALHRGMDIASPRGTPVYASADGVVTLAGRSGGYGNRIEIQHFDNSKSIEDQLIRDKDGQIVGVQEKQAVEVSACGIKREKFVDSITSTYNHLSKIEPGITSGVVVKRGDLIGYVGKTGLSDGGYHLHFETIIDGYDCQLDRRTAGTCDPQLFIDFPELNNTWQRKYTCLQRRPK